MSIIHRFSKGYGWVVKTATIPEPPFLITDKLDARIIYNGLIRIEPTPGTMEELEESEGFISYPVASQDWFGILTYEGTNRIHLLAFSDKESEKLSDSDVFSTENEWVLGEIAQLVSVTG